MNNQEFDLDTVKHFFEHDYHDRGMMKWQGFYLSDHTAALHQQNQQLNEIYVPRPQQSLTVITEVLADAYQRQQPVTIQLKPVDQNNRHLPDITTLIHGYNANDIVIDADRFIPLQEIRNVSFKNTESYKVLALRIFLNTLFAGSVFSHCFILDNFTSM
ncbi:hypothetical protein ITQ83_05130 [Pediococcus pentosaceus]|uniref:DNA-directed RNA polymerase beta subunit n=1 Tax=Pediococcus pentosaceus TaxID=1255 RepID=A0A6L5A250_PEDPE|nr:hypothetical protein GBO26_00305 [Pediococcus pentosaceus]KAF0413865.1 hypothetical protein GBO79_03030 [Pediococcus pentosaceus]KAF0501137.1 hypothetical protein GBP22_09830 [Pediococcus pentosaceus]MBF7106279.1 hypothetical protein [Pediococcus pentosaceus]MBF7108912.1 hypothetical protein [Pediococcus pentosaceus]